MAVRAADFKDTQIEDKDMSNLAVTPVINDNSYHKMSGQPPFHTSTTITSHYTATICANNLSPAKTTVPECGLDLLNMGLLHIRYVFDTGLFSPALGIMADPPPPVDDPEEPYPTRVWRDYTAGSRKMKDPDEVAFNADVQAKCKDDYKKAWSKMKLIPKTPSMPYGKDCMSFAELEDYVTANGQRDRLKCNGY